MSVNYQSLLSEAQKQIEKLQATLDHLSGEITPRQLPVVTFYYPLHGRGRFTPRRVKVIEMNDVYLRGFEIERNKTDEKGQPKTYLIEKIEDGGRVRLVSA
jgi:hypothetical protein